MVDEALRGVRAGGGEGGGEKGREGGLRPGMPAGTSEREGTGACHQNPLFVGIVLLVAGVAVAMIQYKVPTIMAPLMAQFSLDAQTASWLMSVFTLASIVMAIPSGMLAKRFGAKTMMVVACGIAVAGSVVGLFASMAPLLVVSRAIEGAALTILTTCGPLVVRQCVRPDKIGVAMGVWGIWGCVGSTVAAVLVPTLFETAGFSGLWGAFAVVAALAAALVLVSIRVPKDPDGDEAPVPPLAFVCKALVRRDTLLFFVGFAAFNVCLLAVLTYVPTILQVQGFDPTLSGLISTAPMLLSVVSSPLFGAVSDRLGRTKPLLVASMLVMGPCTFLLYTQTGALLWVAVCVMGLVGMGGIGMFLSGYASLVPDPALAAGSMGVMILVQGVGQFLGSYLVQMLLGAQLTQWLFAGGVLMALGLAGAAALLLCRLR